MSIAAALAKIAASGVTLEPGEGNRIEVTSRMPLTEEQRGWIRAHRQELLGVLAQPRWRWLIHHSDGGFVEHDFCPPATLAQVREWYPRALEIVPEDEPEAPPPSAHAPDLRGYALADLEAEAGEDWPEIKDCPEALRAPTAAPCGCGRTPLGWSVRALGASIERPESTCHAPLGKH